ncbi:MAG TPA: hypothetical protein VGP73_18440 [Thermoanaerobaculia bacterium]
MGEEHIRKRHQQLTRCTDAALDEKLRKEDLFSQVPPEEGYELFGYATGKAALNPGDELIEVSEENSPKVMFALGMDAAVELEGEAATLALARRSEFGEPLSAVVVSVDGEFVELRLLTPLKVN